MQATTGAFETITKEDETETPLDGPEQKEAPMPQKRKDKAGT